MDDALKRFLPLLQFENRMKDITANYISITDDYLWRRDSARLVAIKLPQSINGHFDYECKEFSQKYIKELAIQKDNSIKLKTHEETQVLKPVYKTNPNTIKYMLGRQNEAKVDVELDRKRLKEILLILEQKCEMSKQQDPKLIFNFDGNEIFIQGREEFFELPIVEKKKNNKGIFSYSFYLLKDMIYNKYKENIFFSIFDHFVVLSYPDNAWGVLMGCRIKEDELFEFEEAEPQTTEN